MASGLRNTNANSGDYIQVFTDVGCQQDSSTIKYSDLCLTPRYRSLKYFPPGQMQDEEQTEEDIAREAEAEREELELNEQLKRIERLDYFPLHSVDSVGRS